MAISYVGGVAGGRAGATTTTTQSISGTLTGGTNTSPSQGDLIVVWCSAASDGTGAAPNQFVSGNTSGAYQNEAMQSITTVTYDTYAALNWQFAGATPDTTITIPSSGNARNAQRWAIHVFRGVDSAVWDQTSVNASGTASGRPNPSSITPNTAGAWILWLGASAAATGAAYTAPTDFATNWRGGSTVDTADCMDGFGYYTGWTSGAYDPAAITAGGTTNAADSWVAKSAVLKPAPNAYTLTCNHGTYSVTGQSATLTKSRLITASHGTYSLTGQASSINKGRVLTASHGTYSLAGQSAGITWTPAAGYTLTAQHGTYSISGQSASLAIGRMLTAESGSYALTGQSATLLKTYTLVCEAGSYSLAGQSAILTYSGGVLEQPRGGGVGKQKRKRVVVEHDNEVYFFDNYSDAAAFVQAHKAIEKTKDQPAKVTKQVRKVLAKAEARKIDLNALRAFYTDQAKQIEAYLLKRQFDELIEMQIALRLRMQDDEDDIEVLLLT